MIYFYKISSEFLEEGKLYPCEIYLYEPHAEKRHVALYLDSPVKEEDLTSWSEIEEKGAYLQIISEELEMFCETAEIDPQRIFDINKRLIRGITLTREREAKYQLNEKTFKFKTNLIDAVIKKNYSGINSRVLHEVMQFPLNLSEEVSLTTFIVERTFVRDSIPIRIASLAYHLAKINKVKDPEMLCSIILAALYKDSGISQLNMRKTKETER